MTVKKKATRKRKRTLSAAQKAALAKGRKALAARRKTSRKSTRKATTKKKTTRRKTSSASREREAVIIVNQGDGKMSRRKRRSTSRTTRKVSRRRRRSYRSYMGGMPSMKNIQGKVMSAALGTAGAIGITMVTAKVPIENTKLKAFLPLAAGILLSNFAKGSKAAMINQLATGMTIAGGLALVKQFAPQFALAGEDEMYDTYLPENATSLLGVNSDLMGARSDLMGVEDFALEPDDML